MRSLIVHGGAWQIPDAELEAHLEGLRSALDRGRTLLLDEASALDVVTEIVAILEEDPAFDAGRGSVLNQDGRIEMDAALMDGSTKRAGCCLCVSDVAHPIRLARAILEDGRTVMLAGEGASRFARSVGIPACRFEDLHVARETDRKQFLDGLPDYKTCQAYDGTLPSGDAPRGAPLGTVGAVCCDATGRLAAATSTGGAPDTLPGRIGDAPILGAGTWAEDGIGGASSTGWGESILRDLLAFRAVQGIDTVSVGWRVPSRRQDEPHPANAGRITWGPVPTGVGRTPEAWAAREAIRGLETRIGGVGGVILIGPDGTPGFAFNTPRMARGFWIDGMGRGSVEIEPA